MSRVHPDTADTHRAERSILHVDMDAFYAAIEERDCPALRGRPVVVSGAPEGRGVVAAANYAARRYGIHSAMPARRARALCPEAVFVAPRHDRYAEVSRRIRAIFARYTPLMEPLSLDEAFLDVTASERLFGPAHAIGRRIKQEIRDELGLTASVGLAPNKFVAKVASDVRKPDGFVVVAAHEVQGFLDPLPVGRLWGVGRVAGGVLQRLGVETIGGLRRQPPQRLRELFGAGGEQLWRLAHGIDERPVVPDRQAKSISHETTFETDLHDRGQLEATLMELTEQVARRVRRHGLHGRTVEIKIRYADFRTVARLRTLAAPTDITAEIWRAAVGLLTQHLPAHHRGVRLLGVGLSGISAGPPEQGSLFEDATRERQTRIDDVADRIQSRYGEGALRRATDLKRRR